MKRYEQYKDSGVEWIREIPMHWNTTKLKYDTYIKARVGWHGLKADEFSFDEGVLCVTGTDFLNGKVNWDSCYRVSAERYEQDPYIQLRDEDLLITKDGTIGKVAIAKGLAERATLNSGVFVLRPLNEEYLSEFMYWVLQSPVFTEYVNYTSKGSTINHLYQDNFINLLLSLPTLKEQTAISKYLDKKTAQINTLIANKQNLIELLKEERTAIINHAVTKGINPGVKFKSSGIEWLGDIPEHWDCLKIKRRSRKITDGEHISPTFLPEGIPFLSAKDVHDRKIVFEVDKFVSIEDAAKFRRRCNPEKGDLLIVSRGATIGRVGLVETEKEFCLLGSVILIKPNKDKISSVYLYYLLTSDILQNNFRLLSASSAQQAIYITNVQEQFMPFPGLEEQKKIEHYLEVESHKTKSVIEKIEKEIELMQEYRAALISEVITGKVKVI